MSDKRRITLSRSGTNLGEREDALWRARTGLPHYRFANASRRYLTAAVRQLQEDSGLFGVRAYSQMAGLELQQIAMLHLGIIGVHAASSVMTLVAAGYEVDAAASMRRLVECDLRSRAVLADASGEHARRWLAGRPIGKLETLARRFGDPGELTLLGAIAHAEAVVIQAYADPPGADPTAPRSLTIGPNRTSERPELMLYAAGYVCVGLVSGLAKAFDVAIELPRFISSELAKNGDVLGRPVP